MKDLFENSPTIVDQSEKTDTNKLTEKISELEARVQKLEQQVAEKVHTCTAPESPPSSKIPWKKVKKIFRAVVQPILTFIPNFLTAMATLTKARAFAKAR